MHQGGLSRRALLWGALVTTTAGCGQMRDLSIVSPDPELITLGMVIAAKQRVIDLYNAAGRAHPALAGRLAVLLSHHHEHLAELRRRLPAGISDPTAALAPLVAPRRPDALRQLQAAERTAAASRPALAVVASPSLAQLLASIGACEAAHVIALAEAPR